MAENDWLGTRPVFYHEKTGVWAARPDDVIDWRTFEFEADALRDYLEFGYCVFGRTPVKHVRFLQPCRRLVQTPRGLREEKMPDPAAEFPDAPANEAALVKRLEESVDAWARTTRGTVVVPTSGGFDSRLLNLLLPRATPAHAFTYGISDDPLGSSEVVIARAVTEKLHRPWSAVALGSIHQHLDAWHALFGIAAHAHGMYHLEFFGQVRRRLAAGPQPIPLLSGIIGDLWAGAIAPRCLQTPADLTVLGYSHGMHAGEFCRDIPADGGGRTEFWEERQEALRHPRRQLVELARLKMMLLRYLYVVPESLGFRPWSPFLDPDIALAMLHLPAERRLNRAWQQDIFRRHDLLYPPKTGSRQNSLDWRQVRNHPPPPLDAELLSALFPAAAIRRLNRELLSPGLFWTATAYWHSFPPRRPFLARLRPRNRQAAAYAAYCTLRPLEQLLAMKRGRGSG